MFSFIYSFTDSFIESISICVSLSASLSLSLYLYPLHSLYLSLSIYNSKLYCKPRISVIHIFDLYSRIHIIVVLKISRFIKSLNKFVSSGCYRHRIIRKAQSCTILVTKEKFFSKTHYYGISKDRRGKFRFRQDSVGLAGILSVRDLIFYV